MFTRLRLAAGWTAVLVAAILLSLLLPRGAGPRDAAASPSAPGPSGVAAASQEPRGPDRDPIDRLPPFVAWPLPGDWIGAGSAPLGQVVPLGEADAAALEAAADRARLAYRLDALAIGVVIEGTSGWAGASGLARDGLTPLDGDSPFAVASITKTFTAALVLQLVDDRKLRLGDLVAPLLPELGLPPDVTVAQLLGHTAGLNDLLKPLRPELNRVPTRVWLPREVVEGAGEPLFPAGTDYRYSNTNYVVLGLLIERVTGHAFADELEARLLRPLGLETTGLLLSGDAPFLMQPAWASAFGTSGAMYASAWDLLRWGDALYGGAVLHPVSRTRMLSFDEDRYGLGAQELEVGGNVGYGHSGLLQGFTSLLVHLPGKDITLVVLGTSGAFDPAALLAHSEAGQPSILELAEAIARR